MDIAPSYDCVVLGAGPAGCTAATLIADAGYTTLLVEREKLPRFHVGESLMPETYWIFQRLGVLEKMKASNFVKKVSVQFVASSGKESAPFLFTEHDPRECSQTWQVERSKFDHLLFEHASEKGATCVDQTRVLEVLFDGDRATGAKLQQTGGSIQDVTSRVIVDATGQSALIANRLDLKEPHPHLRKAAIWTYFQGADRVPGPHGGATVILHTQSKEAWFWYIPLSEDRTSVGVVGDVDFLLKRDGSLQETFETELGHCPAMQQRLARATRCDGFHAAKEFSYSTKRHAGDGWVLVGDAFGFIDPIYSSGVYFAMKTAELAADAVISGLQSGDTTAAKLGNWSECFEYGARWLRKLVSAFYENEFSFGRFMKEHPEHQANLTDLLIGRIFQPSAGEIFKDLDPAIAGSSSKRELA